MTFHVGQKVVCVDDSLDKWGEYHVKRGAIYTVSEVDWLDIALVSPKRFGSGLALKLVEVKLARLDWLAAARFRPLTDQKKSVSFTIGADPDSERWDNRRKVVEPVNALINASNAVSDRFDRRAVAVQGGVGR